MKVEANRRFRVHRVSVCESLLGAQMLSLMINRVLDMYVQCYPFEYSLHVGKLMKTFLMHTHFKKLFTIFRSYRNVPHYLAICSASMLLLF